MKKQFLKAIKEIGHVIDIWLPLKIQYDEIPGLSVGIVYKGKLLYKNGFGYADLKSKRKTNENTLYRIASISKMFTATAILQLVEKELLRLDDKVSVYLPWFKGKTKTGDISNITVRQLLSHTSGMFRDGDTPHWDTGNFPSDIKKSFSSKSLIQENLTAFKYSNYGYGVLGQLVKVITGEKCEEYVKKHILRPLGMSRSLPDYKKGAKELATGYGRIMPGAKRKIFNHLPARAYAPAGGVISNVNDLAKFISALSLVDNKKKLLGREFKKEMMHPREKTGGNDEYGLGIGIYKIAGRKVVGHSGGYPGFITQVIFDPVHEIGVIVLSNSLASPASSIAFGLLESIYDIVDNFPSYASGKKISFSVYEGIYRNEWADNVVVRVGNTLLNFWLATYSPLKNKAVFKPLGKHRFVIKESNVFSSYGEIASFENFKNGKSQKLIRGASPSRRVSPPKYT